MIEESLCIYTVSGLEFLFEFLCGLITVKCPASSVIITASSIPLFILGTVKTRSGLDHMHRIYVKCQRNRKKALKDLIITCVLPRCYVSIKLINTIGSYLQCLFLLFSSPICSTFSIIIPFVLN